MAKTWFVTCPSVVAVALHLLLFSSSQSTATGAASLPTFPNLGRTTAQLAKGSEFALQGTECLDNIFKLAVGLSPVARLRTPQIIARDGYPVETHHVTTSDGYILTLFRIPHGKRGAKRRHKLPAGVTTKPVVLVHHGIICTSSDWLMNPQESALPYILANTGYDVWLTNARGTSYSDKHVNLTTDDLAYWKFSFHEMGAIDVPAVIDYILAKTKEPALYYTAHSMGTTAFFVAMAMRPEYNAKIRSMYALAPVSYLQYLACPLALFAPFTRAEETIFDVISKGEFLPRAAAKTLRAVSPFVCAASPLAMVVCGAVFFTLTGFDPCQFNTTEEISAIVGHTPDVTSVRTIIHYLQLNRSLKFRRYDYGTEENERRYGCSQPPAYNVSRITAKVAAYWGQNDHVSDPKDVARLMRQLPNVIQNRRVDFDLWTHLDFTYGIDVRRLVYDHVLNLMPKHYAIK